MTTLVVYIEDFPIVSEDEVYSDDSQDFKNIKPRFVYCPHCRYRTMTHLANARCRTCRRDCITFLYNSIVG